MNPDDIVADVRMDRMAWDRLTGLAFYCGCDRGEALRRAIALLDAYVKAHRNGNIMAIVDEDEEITELAGIVNEAEESPS